MSYVLSHRNLNSPGLAAVRLLVRSLEPFASDRLSGAFPGQVVAADATGLVARLAARYPTHLGG